ncbi:MAG: hypothetical protein BZY82_07115 [SAR202 cluster bacterium Io17-Chloro-G3]|nr:MAG: hypothetical protein BZY82_07115 [SAR202 cluster bacterium Io17-Chloro-G3]
MKRLLIRRLIAYAPTVILVTALVFSLVLLLPQDPVSQLMDDFSASEELVKFFRAKYGLDRPIHVQYVDWLGGIFTGDWGYSFRTGERIRESMQRRWLVTIELAFGSMAVTLLIALPVGIYSAVRPYGLGDNTGTVFAIMGLAIPNFWLGIMMIYLFAVILGWVPASGYVEPWQDPLGNLHRMILPVIVSGTSRTANIMRQTRSAMLEVMRQDYIRTAHSKGLTETTVLLRHALRNGMIPVMTVMGLHVASLLEGSTVVETIFGLPGMGQFAVQAALTLDLPAVQASLLLFGTIVILANFTVDILYGFMDPRVRHT